MLLYKLFSPMIHFHHGQFLYMSCPERLALKHIINCVCVFLFLFHHVIPACLRLNFRSS